MPPSQLKRLKASLREQGIVGPQKSKKQKKQNSHNSLNNEKRVHRNEALEAIRDQFNPFEYKWSKGPKFEATSIKGSNASKGSVVGRSHVGKSRAEDNDISNLIAHRNKIGGIIDKRFGENDPTMDPEEKMLHRLAQVAEQRNKQSIFDLEDDEPGQLTHMGKSLSLDGPGIQDDFDEADLLEGEDDATHTINRLKRSRASGDEELGDNYYGEDEEAPDRKKSKQEVMKELIAKSKFHRHERQEAKDQDEDLREELDKELASIHEALRGIKSNAPSATVLSATGSDQAFLSASQEKAQLDKEYDMRLRKLAQDARSKPTERTKTEEEIAHEKARFLQELEARRLKEQDRQERNLRGLRDEDDESFGSEQQSVDEVENVDDNFGLGKGIRGPKDDLGVEDEDEFVIEDDLLAASDHEYSETSDEEEDDNPDSIDEEEDFLNDFLPGSRSQAPGFLTGANGQQEEAQMPEINGVDGSLAYTYDCPESLQELLLLTTNINVLDLPTAVVRIRRQYDVKLKPENKSKLSNLASALIDYISYTSNTNNPAPISIIETLIRHVHSLAKNGHALDVARTCLRHLTEMGEERSKDLSTGDLVVLTIIGIVFNTSDHFHDIVVPAMLTMDRYLGLKVPLKLSDCATGAYLSTLCLHYVQKSERYVPSVMNYIENTLCALAPFPMPHLPGQFPHHDSKSSLRVSECARNSRALAFSDCRADKNLLEDEISTFKVALIETNLKLVHAAIQTWGRKAAAFEIFEPLLRIIEHLAGKRCRTRLPDATQVLISKLAEKLNVSMNLAKLSRRPLELHHHRPLAIKMAIPKFEETYNPNKHYDPDRERTEHAKLQKELKRERKGAIRELRKDAKAIATENLKQKREKDEAYEKKYKRLIAEIQGEEGQESKAYEREKEWRKKGKK